MEQKRKKKIWWARSRRPVRNRPEKKSEDRWDKALLWLAGKTPKSLENCPPNTVIKYKAAGLLILIPAIMALVSGSFAMPLLTDSCFGIVTGTLAFALTVLIIDRTIFIYVKPQQFNVAAIMRLVLIVALGFTLAKPFELRLFEGAIDNQLLTSKQSRKEDAQKSYEEKTAALQQTEQEQAAKVQGIRDRYFKEMEGGNGRWGNGPVAKQMKVELDKEEQVLSDMKTKNIQKIADLRVELESEITVAVSFKTDLSVRLEALSAAMDEKQGLALAGWVLRLILILLDLTPMVLKWMSRDADLEVAEYKADNDRAISEEVQKALRPWRKKVVYLAARLKLEREESSLEFQRMRQMVDTKVRQTSSLVNRMIDLYVQKSSSTDQQFSPTMSRADRQELIAELSRIYEATLNELKAIIEQHRTAERSRWSGSVG